tara:strand:+ start:127 stop:501 length:375 start_codon:yes stop_codon:yes gene_type:complete
LALIVRYKLGFKLMKRLLLVFLILSSNLFAEQGETILINQQLIRIPEVIICGTDDFGPTQEAIEKEIAEFEAKLAKVLADKAAQEIMAEIEAECEAKAKLPKLQPTVCEPNRGGYEAYILGIKN